jgi:hypothetical protein
MPQTSIFQWRDGAGWLVLSGGGDFHTGQTEEVDLHVLTKTLSLNPLAYLWSASDIENADDYLTYLQDLGGRTGFLVDLTSEQDSALQEQLKEAGIIILGDGSQPERLVKALTPPIKAAIDHAYREGATIYAQGKLAALLAAWMPGPSLSLQPGWDWLTKAIVVSPYQAKDDSQPLKNWLGQQLPTMFGLGIPAGTALAFSPQGTLETWGQGQATVFLGRDFLPNKP